LPRTAPDDPDPHLFLDNLLEEINHDHEACVEWRLAVALSSGNTKDADETRGLAQEKLDGVSLLGNASP